MTAVRWPWRRTPPGMVRIKERDLIELQRKQLLAYQLEDEARALKRQGAVAHARLRLHDLAAAERDLASDLAADPPLTSDGRLHEPAFVAAVDAAVWAHRERELAELTATRNA